MQDHNCAENNLSAPAPSLSPSSPYLPDRAVKSQGGLGRDDGQLVVPVVIYQVDHAVKCSVPGPENHKLLNVSKGRGCLRIVQSVSRSSPSYKDKATSDLILASSGARRLTDLTTP